MKKIVILICFLCMALSLKSQKEIKMITHIKNGYMIETPVSEIDTIIFYKYIYETSATFTISEAIDVTLNSATFNISVAANAAVSDRGICYSSQNNVPTTTDFKISEGNGTGSYGVTLTDLTENTYYYARPYAIADETTFYGDVKIFTTLSQEEGIVINDIRWATRNVDMPGTFTANPEDAGMFYQWNRKVGWSNTNPIQSSDGSAWNSVWALGYTWYKENDPCPTGWRVPTRAESQSLADAGSSWSELNGVIGRFIGSGEQSIFLPAAGYRSGIGALLGIGEDGIYGTSSVNSNSNYFLQFYSGNINTEAHARSIGASIRCIAE